MLSQLPPRQQLGLVAIAGFTLISIAYIGGNAMRKPPEVTISQQPIVPPQSQATLPMAKEPPTEVVVHVAGQVNTPKVVRLPPGSRVQDAIEAAGGAKPNADLENINLAAKLEDGTQVYVQDKKAPVVAAEVPEAYKGGPMAHMQAATKATGDAPSGPVSLNTGTQAQLESLPGVGPATAQKIIAYRQEHGGFSSIEELLAVKGIGPKKLEGMRKWLKL